jgi:hypothetical protein
MLKPISIVAVLLLIAVSARGDAGFDPSRFLDKLVPVEIIVEVDRDYPEYQFWFMTEPPNAHWEKVPLAPDHPYRAELHRDWNQLSPFQMRVAKKTVMALDKPPADAINLDLRIDPPRVSFYDSRDRIVKRYRLEITPTGEVKLVLLETNSSDPWFKAGWIAAGVLAGMAVVWFGLWVVRRIRGKGRGAGKLATP